jgi:hypothetical protein
MNQKSEVARIHILARETKQLTYPEAGVKRSQGDEVRTGLITPDGLPVY